MATHVYANDNEIACRATTGRAGPAFPDACHSPPPATAAPKPPGVPAPYPNTCYPADIRNGSRTVFIKGEEIALEKKSYFHTSYGDEAATPGLLEGVISQETKGRGYFVEWSPNVKVEGRCVTRNLDMVTYNHSNPSNTALFPYLSREDGVDHACKEEEKRIEAACEPDPGKHWTEKHCPDLLKFKNNDPLVDSMKELEKLADILPTAPHFLGQLPRQQLLDRHKELLGNNPLTDRDGNPDSPSKLHGDAQELLASLSDCLRARKCNLVPYKTKTHFRKVGSENVETTINQPDPRNPRPLKPGCCPGQTGHHLIPSESLKRENGKKGGCKHYDHNAHNAAPTVCVESAFQHSGTHKRVHHSLANIMKDTFIKRQMKKIKVKGVVKDKRIIGDDKLMTMTDMIEFAVESHQMAFPLSACSEECIRAQLKDFYKKCIRSKARMVKADGTAIDANETVTY